MQKLLIGVFVATCGMFVMGACTPTETGDAGVEDAGEGGEGEGEGEGEQPGAESDTCNPTDADSCETGLICVQGQLTPTVGTCRVDCSADATACPSGRTCQDVLSAALEPVATACLPQQQTRDGQCLAWGDPEACGADMSCFITSVETDEATQATTASFNCKVTCDKNAADADAECEGAERCFESTLIQNFQPNPADPAELLACTPANCEAGGTGCECDVANGFECLELTSGPACVSVPGQCGTPVPPIAASQLVPNGVTADLICNSVEGHSFCDDSMVTSDEEGLAACITGVFGDAAPNDGLCLAICSVPSTDDDQNGTVEGDEVGEFFGCAEGWECTRAASRELLVGPGIDDDNAQFGIKECASANCTEGEPCPTECGAGDYECIDIEITDDNGNDVTVGLCIATIGSCESVSDIPDAGPEADAGVDAGGDTPDAGGEEPDAGSEVEDAGDSDAN